MEDVEQYRRRPNTAESKPDGMSPGEAGQNGTAEAGSEHPLIPMKRVNGRRVFNQAGEEIGKIEDVAVDKRSGKVAYAILSFGGLLGLGESHQPLPWSALAYDENRGGYVVDITEEFLRLAPKLDPSELSGWDDSQQREAFHTYYGATPYW